MKRQDIIIGECADLGYPPREVDTLKIKEMMKKAEEDYNFWNYFWLILKFLFPDRITIYERSYGYLVIVNIQGHSNEELELLLEWINHITLIRSSIMRTDEGELVFIVK